MLSYLVRQVTSSCEIASKLRPIQGLLDAFFKINKQINKNNGVQEKESIIHAIVG